MSRDTAKPREGSQDRTTRPGTLPGAQHEKRQMKTQTKITDIERHFATVTASSLARQTLSDAQQLVAAIVTGQSPSPSMEEAIAAARASHEANEEAQAAWKRLPVARRDLARATVKQAEEIGHVAVRLGDYYSGNTSFHVQWGDSSRAWTETGYGDQYSRSCKYHKTNATHTVKLCPSGVVELVENAALRASSAADGLHLIDLRADGAAVWVRSKGKAIVAESGWIVGNARCCYHSTVSAEDARLGFQRKLEKLEREARKTRENNKAERRARLVARLCGNVRATIADARALGYCLPGIQAFQSRHNIGDEATLPELVRTGDPSAVRLALSVARKVATVH